MAHGRRKNFNVKGSYRVKISKMMYQAGLSKKEQMDISRRTNHLNSHQLSDIYHEMKRLVREGIPINRVVEVIPT